MLKVYTCIGAVANTVTVFVIYKSLLLQGSQAKTSLDIFHRKYQNLQSISAYKDEGDMTKCVYT